MATPVLQAPSPPTFVRGGRWPTVVLLVAVAVTGLALRIWLIAAPTGDLDSDEAIVGLMARRILDGQFDTFFLGQSYGGSQEAVVSGLVFAVTGSSTVVLKLVMVAFTVATTILTWRVGLRTIGHRGAALAACLMWLGPPFALLWSTKARMFYGMSSVAALVAILAALRLVERSTARDAAVLGLAVGLGWWASPQSAAVAGGAVLWAVIVKPALWRRAPIAIATAVLGALPWIVYNLRNDWDSLHTPPLGREASFLERFRSYFDEALPRFFGFTDPLSAEWRVAPFAAIAFVAAGLLVAAWVVAAFRARDRRIAIAAPLVVFPVYFATNPFTANPEPRYVWVIWPILMLAVADLLVRAFRFAQRSQWAFAAVPVAALCSTLLVADFVDAATEKVGAWDVRAGDPAPLIDELLDRGYTHVHADYWIAYKLSFESKEKLIGTGTQHVRGLEDHAAVMADPRPAFVAFASDPAMVEHIRAAFARHDIEVEQLAVREWVAFLPLADVPAELRGQIYPAALS